MPGLDVFKADAFSMRSLTAAINRMPYAPGKLGALGIFDRKGIRTTHMEIERKGGKISLLPSTERGAPGTGKERSKRTVRTVKMPHIPHDAEILADQVQDVRSFGSESELESVAEVVNEYLTEMRANHEVTLEYFRCGAIKGQVIDGDGQTVLLDLFNEFGVTEKTVDFVLGTSSTKLKTKCAEIARHIETALGQLTYTGIQAVCGDTFWDKLVSHPDVEAAFDRWQEGAFLREVYRDQPGAGGQGFVYGGIHWMNYRGSVGASPFIPATDARVFPLGVAGLFPERYAPADVMGAVNTMGQPVYAMQERLPHDKGISLHTQSNPMTACTIPEVLVKAFTSN